MMVVVVIIGIIATVSNQRDRAAQELSRVAVAGASAAIERFHADHGRAPRSGVTLAARGGSARGR